MKSNSSDMSLHLRKWRIDSHSKKNQNCSFEMQYETSLSYFLKTVPAKSPSHTKSKIKDEKFSVFLCSLPVVFLFTLSSVSYTAESKDLLTTLYLISLLRNVWFSSSKCYRYRFFPFLRNIIYSKLKCIVFIIKKTQPILMDLTWMFSFIEGYLSRIMVDPDICFNNCHAWSLFPQRANSPNTVNVLSCV